MPMTPDAKKLLSSTIRALRDRLLQDLHAATEASYRLSIRAQDAGLPEAARVRRDRLELWIAEQVRAEAGAGKKGNQPRDAEAFRREVEKQAAYTLLNRLVILRLMEATELRAPTVVTGGWDSRGYKDFRSLAPALVRGDESEGYAFLLRLVFEDLAHDLPGIFGSAGVAELVPVPPATLRHVVEALDQPELESCWTDDMTLGWVYQYWNDPEREALDAKLNAGGKVEPHEIASKTQMFTERYIVDWLLQNSLGPMWLAMCQKQGWTPQVQADGTLEHLEQRRADWRGKRERGEVALTELMPLHNAAERRWAYYLPQPIPDDAVAQAPDSVRDIKLLDPALGSGHFLVVAFELLFALYREEARQRGEQGGERWSDQAIAERILSHNLHGIDLDARAVQIAAAALWLKTRQIAPAAQPQRMNLVASNLRLASLADDDSALVELRREVERETGIPGALTDTIINALKGADHLGSLLKVDAAVDAALGEQEAALGRAQPEQGGLFSGYAPQRPRVSIDRDQARATILERLEGFLARHTRGEDLGLRLRGEQLAAGVRFVRLVQEGQYHLVVGNPPYQTAQRMRDDSYLRLHYSTAKFDLYASFLLRSVQLCRVGGSVAMVTMRSWLFIQQYEELRAEISRLAGIARLGDVDRGAFSAIGGAIVAATLVVLFETKAAPQRSVAIKPTPEPGVQGKIADLLLQRQRHEFSLGDLAQIPGSPVVYWWTSDLLHQYASLPKLGDESPVRVGLATSNNARFLRLHWEVARSATSVSRHRSPHSDDARPDPRRWVPYVKGGGAKTWFEPLAPVLNWLHRGVENKVYNEFGYGSHTRQVRNEAFYFLPGVAFSATGTRLRARAHRYRSVFDVKGQSVFHQDIPYVMCLMNSAKGRYVLESLNPTISFQASDATRLPLFPMPQCMDIAQATEEAFTTHESHREPSAEFTHPGRSPWRHAQDWAQAAVDRPEGAPLHPYETVHDPEPPTDHIGFALGVALGRFGPNREGILDPATADLSHALPAGILFLDGTLDSADHRDCLGHPAARTLPDAWATHGRHIDTKRSNLRDYLTLDFFGSVHRQLYENRPIHWPLCSSSKTFVAWVNIHRWTADTLTTLLADHLVPTLTRLDGELADLRAARDGADLKAARAAEKRFAKVHKSRQELVAFIADVEACAEQGPPPTDAKCPPRGRDARYVADLDDGVMINSAALWPLLAPQWKDPKKWWKELCNAKGRKDYDWSHLAMRYWPERVDRKCQDDPSLGVAHGCFWRYHPARAWGWELRLQDEIAPGFRIEEGPYLHPDGAHTPNHTALRAAWLAEYPDEALAAVEKEALRRMGRGKDKKLVPELTLLEPGLWSDIPDSCWALELKLSEKQGYAFHLRSPDEAGARAAYEAEHPAKVKDRQQILAKLAPAPELFAALQADSAEGSRA